MTDSIETQEIPMFLETLIEFCVIAPCVLAAMTLAVALGCVAHMALS